MFYLLTKYFSFVELLAIAAIKWCGFPEIGVPVTIFVFSIFELVNHNSQKNGTG
jgi:hypothetical protein